MYCTSFKVISCFYLPDSLGQIFFYLVIIIAALILFLFSLKCFWFLKCLIVYFGCTSFLFSAQMRIFLSYWWMMSQITGLRFRSDRMTSSADNNWGRMGHGLVWQCVACLLGVCFYSWHWPYENWLLADIYQQLFTGDFLPGLVAPFLDSQYSYGFTLFPFSLLRSWSWEGCNAGWRHYLDSISNVFPVGLLPCLASKHNSLHSHSGSIQHFVSTSLIELIPL